MSSSTGEASQRSTTSEKHLHEDYPERQEFSNGQFESQIWSDWPKWNPGGYQKGKFFPALLEPILDLDTKQCAVWKDEVQNLLILAGLFSAVVTAFVIESYRTLQPDPNDQIIALLSLIAANQMNATIGNASPRTASVPTVSSFVPSPSNIRVNIYWFISLVLSLAVALIGIIAQQWLREHQLYRKDMDPLQQFAVFNARSDGLKRWYVPQIFAGLPLLLQAALVLFFIGLVEFLFAIQIDVAIPVLAAVGIPIIFLVATTILPTLQLSAMHFPYFLRMNDRPPAPCPYKSPQALLFQNAVILSAFVFESFSSVFSILWIPFVVVARLFVYSDKPFYGRSAPFNTNDMDYRCSRDRLRNAARKWAAMDIQWLATRTSYAVAIQSPNNVQDPQRTHVANTHLTELIGFYDLVSGIKQVANSSDPGDWEHRRNLTFCMDGPVFALVKSWADPIKASRTNPEAARALQAHLGTLLRVVSRYNYPQTEHLVDLLSADESLVYDAFLAVCIDQAWGSELNFSDQCLDIRIVTHMKLTRLYLFNNARELFLCSNRPGITPSFLQSARPSLAYHRSTLEGKNTYWMHRISPLWSQTLRQIILDVSEVTPSQPFTGKCTGFTTSRCGSNLHTESVIELTQYILLFQVSDDIQHTLRLLHDHCTSNPNPVQERPLVLIIACAYINAVANVNQDVVEGFSTLVRTICELCGSQDATLEARPGGMGRYWPRMESAFDYIRNHACKNQAIESVAAAASHLPELKHSVDAADSV